MVSRRRLLHGTTALLTALAGCGQSSTEDAPAEPKSDGDNFERNPESYALRNTAEEPPAWLPDDRDGSTTAETTGPPEHAGNRNLVASEASAARLRFADVPDADHARQFVTSTDFDADTLFVESRPVEECRTLELCHVTWSDTEIETQYGGRYREADASCRTDAKDVVSWLIRVPDSLDPEAVRSYGSGWSSTGCQRRRRDTASETTDAPNLGPATNATGTEDDR